MRRDLGAGRRSCDLLVIGGGIYGAWIARDAALRGLSVQLVERGDFGHATSANSLRIVHGGLRYLQHGDLKRVRDSIRERGRLLALAPHLVRPLPFAVPVYGHGLRGRLGHAIGLALANLLGKGLGDDGGAGPRIPRSRVVSREAMLRICPDLPHEGLTGGAIWHDGQVRSTERLLVAVLESASAAGARLANYAEAVRLLRRGHRVAGAVVRDLETGDEIEIEAGLVVNAAGPWVDAVLRDLPARGAARTFFPSKGLNLLTRRLHAGPGLGMPGPAGFRDEEAWVRRASRLFFIVPWRGYSLIGTRHLPYDGDPESFAITPADVRLFLDEINEAHPTAALEPVDVLAVFGGMLPRVPGSPAGEDVQLQKRRRVVDEEAERGVPGLITVVGIKWTTARAVAEEVVTLACRRLGHAGSRPVRPLAPLGAAGPADLQRSLARAVEGRPPEMEPGSMLHLLRTYAASALEVLGHVREDPSLGLPVRPECPVLRAEVVHAVRAEMARHLDDVLRRRTELGLAGHPGAAVVAQCARLMARELEWTPERTSQEVERTERALAHPLAGPPAVPPAEGGIETVGEIRSART